MTNKLKAAVGAILCLLFLAACQPGKEAPRMESQPNGQETGGGSQAHSFFVARALWALENLEQNLKSQKFLRGLGVEIKTLKKAFDPEKVIVTEGPLRDALGNEVDALVKSGKVYLLKKSWENFAKQEGAVDALVMKELLRLAGYNHGNEAILKANQITEHLQLAVRFLERREVVTSCRNLVMGYGPELQAGQELTEAMALHGAQVRDAYFGEHLKSRTTIQNANIVLSLYNTYRLGCDDFERCQKLDSIYEFSRNASEVEVISLKDQALDQAVLRNEKDLSQYESDLREAVVRYSRKLNLQVLMAMEDFMSGFSEYRNLCVGPQIH